LSAVKYWLWLSTATNVKPKSKAALLSHFGSPEAVYFADKGDYKRLLGNEEGLDYLEMRDLGKALTVLDECEEESITPITVQDALYPDRLKNIYAPPSVIYIKGKLPAIDDEAVIALIGTRKASPYGLKMAQKLGSEIVSCGGIVASGLTSGAELAGVKGALLAGGKVIGVLGTSHADAKGSVYEDVAAVGALISEYPPGTPASRSYFRTRNRITAGLSVGVAVVEAPEKSGTRLFADEAAEQGKEIFAVPGNADSPNCVGSNELLKEGAKPITNGWDIMSEFSAVYPQKIRNVRCRVKPEEKPETPHEDKKVIDKPQKQDYIDLKKQLEGLTETQLRIVDAIEVPSTHVDEIIEKTELPSSKVLSDLTLLQLKGYVKQEQGKRFTLNLRTK